MRGEARERLGRGNQATRLDPAVNLPRDEQIVLVPESFIDLKNKRCQLHIHTAPGERELDRSRRVNKLPDTNLECIQMLIAPAEGHLQGRMELSQGRLLGDHEPGSDRRRIRRAVGR